MYTLSQLFIVFARHQYINIIIPLNKSAIAFGAQGASARQNILQIILLADQVKIFQHIQQNALQSGNFFRFQTQELWIDRGILF